MIAQFYDDADFVRIFLERKDALMDCHCEEDNIKSANEALKRCHLRRNAPWVRREWGWECKVSWREKRT